MIPTPDNLKGTFQLAYDTYLDSRNKADKVYAMFHNDQWEDETVQELRDAGRPVETFNIIRMFTRQLMGYYSTVSNTVEVRPTRADSTVVASVLNDAISYVDRQNNTIAINEKLRLSCLLSGLMVSYLTPVARVDRDGNEALDEFGRNIYDINKEVIHPREILLDPNSVEEDYSDAKFIHRYRWLSEEDVKEMFKGFDISKLVENSESVASTQIDMRVPFQNQYRYFNSYLIVHTIMVDGNDTYSVYWSGDEIISKKKITHNLVKFPYQVVKLQDTYEPKYYGIFEDVVESQIAINQALTQIQLMTNSNKVIVRKGAVDEDDWVDFKKAIVRVNAVLELDNPEDVKILNMNGEIGQQYLVIDKALDRIQRVLGVNDSFLGMAYASDSGRKVKLQQNATMMALRYLDVKFNLMFKLIGTDEVHLIQQYYRAHQLMRITDNDVGIIWAEINKPLVNPLTGTYEYHAEIDPDTGDYLKDSYGNYILTPLNDPDTDIQFADVDIDLVTVAYNDDDEKSQLMVENILSGNMGLELRKYNPAGFLKISGKLVGNMKFKYSNEVQKIFEQTAALVAPQIPGGPPLDAQQLGGQGSNSQSLKLPTNTNEGV